MQQFIPCFETLIRWLCMYYLLRFFVVIIFVFCFLDILLLGVWNWLLSDLSYCLVNGRLVGCSVGVLQYSFAVLEMYAWPGGQGVQATYIGPKIWDLPKIPPCGQCGYCSWRCILNQHFFFFFFCCEMYVKYLTISKSFCVCFSAVIWFLFFYQEQLH